MKETLNFPKLIKLYSILELVVKYQNVLQVSVWSKRSFVNTKQAFIMIENDP